jgi:predicted signal transduction protein with EAL and GGDEF domain
MSENFTELSGNALFQLRVRQAILAAQHGVKQVSLLLIDFDYKDPSVIQLDKSPVDLSEKIWLRLKSAVRDSDTVAGMAGGTMAVLLASVNGAEDAILVANKILNKLEEPILIEGWKIELQAHVGIAMFPEHGSNATILMQRAELALITARRARTSFVLYSEDHDRAHRAPLRMSELRQAIVEDQLFLLYQPKVNLDKGGVSGVEVLARWQHPELGLISPDEFIPIAERTGLIIPLTLWVLHQALLQCRAWHDAGIDVSVAVNLSMWNLEAQELPDQIEGLLKSVGITPDKLELEITESAIMGDAQRTMQTLTRIRDLGVRFAIDDFGTGYSSLAYLKKLPVASIKIDKSFVLNMEKDRDDSIIVRSIVDLGHNLGLQVVAEGVETLESEEMLRVFQCDIGQGYYYSRPIPAYATTKFLTEPFASIQEPGKVQKQLASVMLNGATHINGSSRIPKADRR